jgi:hypothetical protein
LKRDLFRKGSSLILRLSAEQRGKRTYEAGDGERSRAAFSGRCHLYAAVTAVQLRLRAYLARDRMFYRVASGRGAAKFHGAGLTVQRRADASLAGDSVDCGIAVIYIYVITMNIVLRAVQGRMGAYLTRDGLLGRGTLMGAMVSHTYSLSFMG